MSGVGRSDREGELRCKNLQSFGKSKITVYRIMRALSLLVSFRPSEASGEILRYARTGKETGYRTMNFLHRVISTKAKPHGEILRYAEAMQEI